MKKSAIILMIAVMTLAAIDVNAKARKQKRNRKPRYEQVQGTSSDSVRVLVEEVTGEKIYADPDVMPQYRGGQEALMKKISETLVYPERAEKDGVQGRVLVMFVVEKNGHIGRIKLARSSGDTRLDNEALRVVAYLPPFIPAQVHGKPVACWFTLPITFKLD